MSSYDVNVDFDCLEVGDILFFETPFDDATENDYFPLYKNKGVECNHCAVYVGGDRPVAHVVTEGYKLPGLRLTKMSAGKICVFRIND